MKHQVIVIGLGRFGMSVARALLARGHEVLGIDQNGKIVQDAAEFVTQAVIADGADEDALRELGAGSFEVAIIGIGEEVLASIMSTLMLKSLGVRWVIARAQSELHGEALRRVGADKVIYPEQQMGERLAHSFISANVIDYLEVAPDYGVSKVDVPDYFVGRSPVDLRLHSRFGITVVAIRRGDDVIIQPHRDEQFRAGDVLVLIGRDDQLEAMLLSTNG